MLTSAIHLSDNREVGNQEDWRGIRDMEGELVDVIRPLSVVVY